MNALPTISVVIRTRNEAPRLRLTLASLARQPVLETIVVDDCSDDATPAVAAEAARHAPVIHLRNERNLGRSGASNAGARAARGEVLLFLDGDTPAGPDCIERLAKAHASEPNMLGRGETWHLRCTRFLLDPETASPRPGEEARVARMTPQERERAKVTREQVENDFASIERRAEPGVYPGVGPRRLQELELEAIRTHPDSPMLWAAATGSNMTVRRHVFLDAGAFDEDIHLNEHREGAFRLVQAGAKVRFIEGAKTYHLTHRTGWRNPLATPEWELAFYRRHPYRSVKLVPVFWACISGVGDVRQEWRIESLAQIEQCAREWSDEQVDALRARIPGLAALPPAESA